MLSSSSYTTSSLPLRRANTTTTSSSSTLSANQTDRMEWGKSAWSSWNLPSSTSNTTAPASTSNATAPASTGNTKSPAAPTKKDGPKIVYYLGVRREEQIFLNIALTPADPPNSTRPAISRARNRQGPLHDQFLQQGRVSLEVGIFQPLAADTS